MSNRPSIPAKEIVGNSDVFTGFMRRLVQVPHSEIKAKLDAERETKRASKPSVSRVPAVTSSILLPEKHHRAVLCNKGTTLVGPQMPQIVVRASAPAALEATKHSLIRLFPQPPQTGCSGGLQACTLLDSKPSEELL